MARGAQRFEPLHVPTGKDSAKNIPKREWGAEIPANVVQN